MGLYWLYVNGTPWGCLGHLDRDDVFFYLDISIIIFSTQGTEVELEVRWVENPTCCDGRGRHRI